MPYADPHSKEARESVKRRSQRYRQKHKEKIQAYRTQYFASEHFKDWKKEYDTRDYVKKYNTIKNWKRIGVIFDDYDDLYDLYCALEYCMECGKDFDKSINKHLDHDHESGKVRAILCRGCNIKRR